MCVYIYTHNTKILKPWRLWPSDASFRGWLFLLVEAHDDEDLVKEAHGWAIENTVGICWLVLSWFSWAIENIEPSNMGILAYKID